MSVSLVCVSLKKSLQHVARHDVRMMDPETQHATYIQEATAGCGTAVVQVLVTNPYELIKIRQQTVAGQARLCFEPEVTASLDISSSNT